MQYTRIHAYTQFDPLHIMVMFFHIAQGYHTPPAALV